MTLPSMLYRTHNEDCVLTMQRLPSDCIDLVVTSPPYGALRKYDGIVFDLQKIVRSLYVVIKQGGVIVWVVADQTIKGSETGESFRHALCFMENGFNLHDTMIYAKNSYMPLTHNRYEQQFEYMFVFSKGKPKTFNPIMVPTIKAGTTRNRGGSKAKESTYAERKRAERTIVKNEKQAPNIFWYDVGKNDKTEHNAPFPEQLAYDHIITWTNRKDVVYDPFMGSGTTAKMAILAERKWLGSEISKAYCGITKNRIKQTLGE